MESIPGFFRCWLEMIILDLKMGKSLGEWVVMESFKFSELTDELTHLHGPWCLIGTWKNASHMVLKQHFQEGLHTLEN